MSQSSISTHPFSVAPLFRGYLTPLPPFTLEISVVKSVEYQPCSSKLASRIHPKDFISLSRMLVEFFLKLVYSTMGGKSFQIYGVHVPVPRKCIKPGHFYSCPHFPTHNSPPRSYHQYPRQRETIICFIKIQSEIIKITWSVRLFIFCMICNFVMALQFCK